MISNFIHELMQYGFLQNALITAVVIGIVSGVIGCFIILRGMSLMGDAISHAVLPGVAISYLLGINFLIGAIAFGIFASILITFISRNSTIKGDTSIGIIFSSFLALGVILINTVVRSSTDLFHILFGNILAVTHRDMMLTIVIALIVLVVIFIFFKEFQVTSFDSSYAQAYGLNVSAFHYLLMFLLTMVAVTAMQTVGTILIVAMLITPAATAFLFTKRLHMMVLLAASIGVVSSISGLVIGNEANIPIGSMIVLINALFFTVGFFISPRQKYWAKLKTLLQK